MTDNRFPSTPGLAAALAKVNAGIDAGSKRPLATQTPLCRAADLADKVRALVAGDARLSEETRAMVNHLAGRLAAAADAEREGTL